MPPDRDRATVLDIVAAARLVLQFVRGLDYAGFLADRKTQSAVIHQLLVIGEAAKRLSPEFKSAHAGIPWQSIARMRDKMIHHYDAVDIREVWKAIEADIPKLLAAVEPLVPPEGC